MIWPSPTKRVGKVDARGLVQHLIGSRLKVVINKARNDVKVDMEDILPTSGIVVLTNGDPRR